MNYNLTKYFYYLYEFTVNGLVQRRTFENYVELIEFLAKAQRGKKYQEDKKIYFNNDYLDRINLTLNDCFIYEDYKEGPIKYIRPYVFFNQDLAIVDVRDFYDDIFEMAEFLSTRRYYNHRSLYYEKLYKGHVFRRSPIPYTAKHRGGSICRNVKYGRIIRDFKNPENKDFIRKKKYYDILEPYFDRPFKRETKCWKNQTKKRHQWEKHMK